MLRADQGGKARRGSGGAAGAAGAAGEEAASSSDLLTKAVLMYPVVVQRLMRKLQEKGTGGWAGGCSE